MGKTYDILAWRGTLDRQRELFLLNYKEEIEAFDAVDRLFPLFARATGRIPIVKAKTTFHLAPLIEIMQRRARTAFELFACRQSPQAWSALRPFVEAPIFMGKWIDDPQNAVVWQSRHTGKSARKQYHEVYGGSNLRATCLPHDEAIRGVLNRLSDDFIETDPRFYAHPVHVADGKPKGRYVEDDADQRAHVYAMLHLVWFVMHSVGRMLAGKGGGKQDLRVDLDRFERSFGPAAEAIARQNEVHKAALAQLGLWPHGLLHTKSPRRR